MGTAEEGPRNDAGKHGETGDLEGRVEALLADPQELRRYVARQDELERRNRDLERLRGLTLDVVLALAAAARQAGQSSG